MAIKQPKRQTPVNNSEGVTKVAVKVNFKQAATSFPSREKGDYDVTFIGHTINPASASSGQPTATLTWSEDNSPNKKIMKTYSLQPQALWSLKRDMLRMGANVEDMNDEDADLDDILNSLIGSKSVIVMGEPRDGKDKEGNDRTFDNFLEVKDPSKL